MTDNNHPITPPIELVKQWCREWTDADGDFCRYLDTQAARWGADQELEACCEWLREAKNHGFGYDYGAEVARKLHAGRRPKPPSLKEQALTQLDSLHADLKTHGLGTNTDTIRRALEQLND